MKPAFLLAAAALLLGLAALTAAAPAPLPEATAARLPRWRGFNLTEKFNLGENRPFREEDFQIISELGFNFARLPLDYRIWIKNGDWRQIDESALAGIDQALAYGEKYGVHVCLAFHRAPGYSVAPPKEARDLWTDAEAQEVCALHWARFARRYRGIPNNRLSFNLLNEPGDVASETYRAVVEKLVQAIRAEDPGRLIIADGLKWGTQPCPELAPLGVAQATRGYTPIEFTHYRASWIAGGVQTAPPVWPMPRVSSVVKQGYPPDEPSREIVIQGPFTAPTAVSIRIGKVQPPCEVAVTVDGQPLVSRRWEAALEKPETLEVEVPAGSGTLRVAATANWALACTFDLRPRTGGRFVFEPWENWDAASVPVRFVPGDAARPFQAAETFGRDWLRARMIEPWKALEERGVGVMVGEFGVYNKTPHPATLRYLEDVLGNWREAGWGWALWNLRGNFGILDSGRPDVVYEPYRGHQLDRAMLEVLRKY